MAEKYVAEGVLRDETVTAPNGERETVILYPVPRKVTMTANVLLAMFNSAAGDVDATVTFKAKNGTASYKLTASNGRTFTAELVHDNLHG